MRLTRRQLLAGAAAGALGAGGIYELVDQLSGEAPERVGHPGWAVHGRLNAVGQTLPTGT